MQTVTKRTEMTILLSRKIGFKTKKLLKTKRDILYETKFNSEGSYNNNKYVNICRYVCTWQFPKICETKIDGIEEGNRWYNNNWKGHFQ